EIPVAWLVRVTSAPGRMAPLGSVTRPVMVPCPTWARSCIESNAHRRNHAKDKLAFSAVRIPISFPSILERIKEWPAPVEAALNTRTGWHAVLDLCSRCQAVFKCCAVELYSLIGSTGP